MGVKVEDFLYDYFSLEQLKDALYDIGVPAGKTKKECVDKILEKWTAYNRSWYDLLDFLDTEDLQNICEHFKIEYTDWDNEESLMDKIEENWVLDFRIKQKKRTKKESIETPSIHIGEQNISIGSNNSINSHNKTQSKDTSNTLSKNQKIMIIITIVGILVTVGIAVYENYNSAIENWNDSNSINESPNIIIPEIDEKNLPEHQRIIQTYNLMKPYSIIFTGCNLHASSDQNEETLEYEISLDPQIIDKDGNIATIPFNSSYHIISKANIEGVSYLVDLDSIQISKYTINPSGDGRLVFNITKTLSDAKEMNALGITFIFDRVSITPYSDIINSNILPYQKVLEDREFLDLVYLPDYFSKWAESGNKKEICQS